MNKLYGTRLCCPSCGKRMPEDWKGQCCSQKCQRAFNKMNYNEQVLNRMMTDK